ncbi:hypothetical protein VTO42DRAFT_7304 [Malbranchea cinnamomea]
MKLPLRRAALVGRGLWVCNACRASFSTTAVRAAKKKPRRALLPNTPARTRFAPSPTGYLHLGSLRTALFNYLLAKRTGGQFLLRIEDTDQKRTIPGAEQRLYDDLHWAGLQWDEGPVVGGPYGPYRQSERTALYSSEAQKLISSGNAYRCFCSPERLDALARHRHELGLPPGYDGICTHISKEESDDRAARGESYVVRLRVAEPYPLFDDIVYGTTGQNRAGGGATAGKNEIVDTYLDPILLKSDGHPTYHLANVVDDHYMKITHVIRGTEWMSSTPMHVALYRAFNWEPPQFGHVPLLVDPSGQKLSKRNADIDISHFRDEKGIMPSTLVNFAALLGWSHTSRSDVFTLAELEEAFDLKITKGNATVAFEKLWFLQKAHARRIAASNGSEFTDMVNRVSQAALKTFGEEEIAHILKSRPIRDYVSSILREGARSYTTAEEFVSQNASFFTQTLNRPAYTSASKPASDSSAPTTTSIPLSALHTAAAALSMVPESFWTAETHRANIEAYTYDLPAPSPSPSEIGSSTDTATGSPPLNATPNQNPNQVFRKELYHYLRWALSAGAPGIGIPSTMAILGREESVRRLEEARALTGGNVETRRAPPVNRAPGEIQSREWMGTLAGFKSSS